MTSYTYDHHLILCTKEIKTLFSTLILSVNSLDNVKKGNLEGIFVSRLKHVVTSRWKALKVLSINRNVYKNTSCVVLVSR